MYGDLVSIIIPVYNVEKYLSKCLDAAIQQTYKNLEIILVNDGATDGSSLICKKYLGLDSRIKLVTKENGGLSSARNAGLEVAKGEYCYFYDSDDYIELHTIERSLRLLDQEKADLIAFNVDHVLENGELLKIRNIGDKVYEIKSEKDRFQFYTKVYYNCEIGFEVWNKLFRMNIIREHCLRFENNYEVFAEDICFLSYYLTYVNRVISTSNVLYHYLIRSNSIMGKNSGESKIYNITKLLKKVDIFINKNNGVNNMIGNHFSFLFIQVLHNRFRLYPYYKLPQLILKDIQGEHLDYFNTMIERVLHDKKRILNYYNTMPNTEYELGDILIEEAKLAKYAGSRYRRILYLFIVTIKRLIRKYNRGMQT